MGYCLALVLMAVAALVVAVVRSSRPHPRHEFILGMVARMEPGEVAGDFAPIPRSGEDEAA